MELTHLITNLLDKADLIIVSSISPDEDQEVREKITVGYKYI